MNNTNTLRLVLGTGYINDILESYDLVLLLLLMCHLQLYEWRLLSFWDEPIIRMTGNISPLRLFVSMDHPDIPKDQNGVLPISSIPGKF